MALDYCVWTTRQEGMHQNRKWCSCNALGLLYSLFNTQSFTSFSINGIARSTPLQNYWRGSPLPRSIRSSLCGLRCNYRTREKQLAVAIYEPFCPRISKRVALPSGAPLLYSPLRTSLTLPRANIWAMRCCLLPPPSLLKGRMATLSFSLRGHKKALSWGKEPACN